jgi:glucose-6-phosphate 1-dehydrogenase
MDPPAAADPDSQKDAKQAVFVAMADAKPEHYVRGQYEGYRDIDGVAKNSRTETFAALRLDIDSWRWSGVPFFIRTGKRLPITQTELRLVFRNAPRLPFISRGRRRPEPSQIVFRVDPHSGVRISLDGLRADKSGASQIDLNMEFAKEGGEGATPYEVLLHAALVGDASHFTRQDNVEECWRVLQPLLDAPPKALPYAQGSWGPQEAGKVADGFGGWRGPWLPT